MSSSSFYWAMRLLPRQRRDDMFALYGFCRAVDDIADGTTPTEDRAAKLAVVRGAIAAFFETGLCLSPILEPLIPAIRRHNLPRCELESLIDGMESDVNAPLTAPDRAELSLYCRRVAGTVGVLAIHILGRPDAGRFAQLTAEALQLTNILRDLDEDAQRGRLYLPQDCLEQAGIISSGPQSVLTHPSLGRACLCLSALAQQHFIDAKIELERIGRDRLWPAIAMLATYRVLLQRMQRHGWVKRDSRPRLTTAHKLWLAIRAAAFGL